MLPMLSRRQSRNTKYNDKFNVRKSQAAIRIQNEFPTSDLKVIDSTAQRQQTSSYTSHDETLNFISNNNTANSVPIGRLCIGLYYDTDSRASYHEKDMCMKSTKHIQFLLAVKESLLLRRSYFLPRSLPLGKLRVECIIGAQTSRHTDTFRGPSPGYFMIHSRVQMAANGEYFVPSRLQGESHFRLKVWLFPKFRSSVVLLGDRHYIPHSFSKWRDELVLIGEGASSCIFHIFPSRCLEKLQPYGSLEDIVVVGVKQKKLQVMSTEIEELESSKSLKLIPFSVALEQATANRQECKSRRTYITYTKNDTWHKIWPWKYAHEAVGNSLQPRTHVFFRLIREVCPSSYVRRSTEGTETHKNRHDKYK